MLRRFVLAATALAASAFAFAPSSAADGPQPSYDGDVPGINYQAFLSAPCFQWERFIFGRGPGGEALLTQDVVDAVVAARAAIVAAR